MLQGYLAYICCYAIFTLLSSLFMSLSTLCADRSGAHQTNFYAVRLLQPSALRLAAEPISILKQTMFETMEIGGKCRTTFRDDIARGSLPV